MKTAIQTSISILLNIIFLLSSATLHAQDSINTTTPSRDSTIVGQTKVPQNTLKEYDENYYILRYRNQVYSPSEIDVNRETPQAALENFILNARKGDFKRASYSLNLNLLPDDVTIDQVNELTQKLFILINKNINLDWDKLSDRPDGQLDEVFYENEVVAGKPRRSIAFGKLDLDQRVITLRLQRIKYETESPYWVISSNTVENIDALYANYGPKKIVRLIPAWALEKTVLKIPIWKILGSLIAIIISGLLFWFTIFILRRVFVRSRWKWISAISFRLAMPAALFVAVLSFYFIMENLIVFDGGLASSFYTLLLIATVGFGTWFVMRFMDAFISYLAENKTEDIYAEENIEVRRMLTHLSVARRIVTFVILLVGAGIILSQFEGFKNLGVSLFASAGVATIIIGIAAQSTLGNIIAGIQIAVTKPAQIGDMVILKDQWGHVEDIGFVYMIIKTWDERRIVIPLKSIISNSFENWSMRGSKQTRSIDIYTDYRIDIQKVRDKFEILLTHSSKWNKEVAPSVQVIDSNDKAIKIRAMVSADDPFTAWDLQCELREKLIAYICELEDGLGLPQTRVAMKSGFISDNTK